MSQSNPGQEFLDLLDMYGSFMESIDTLVDLGCGEGADLNWWATRNVLDDNNQNIPLNIKCTGVDLQGNCHLARQQPNVSFEKRDFETIKLHDGKKPYDVLWCNNSFQYLVNPFEGLKAWRNIMSEGGMLAMVVPSTFEAGVRSTHIAQHEHTLYHWSTVSLLHILAMSGFEVPFMQKKPNDPWIKVVAYKSEHEPFDPKTTRMYDLLDKGLLPDSAEECILRFGYLKQDQLVLDWLDKSAHWFGED